MHVLLSKHSPFKHLLLLFYYYNYYYYLNNVVALQCGLYEHCLITGLDHCHGFDEAIACLKAMPVTEFVDRGPHLLFYPIVDGDVILEHPMKSLYERRFLSRVDALIIVTTDEAYHFVANYLREVTGCPTTSQPIVDVALAKRALHAIVFEKSVFIPESLQYFQ